VAPHVGDLSAEIGPADALASARVTLSDTARKLSETEASLLDCLNKEIDTLQDLKETLATEKAVFQVLNGPGDIFEKADTFKEALLTSAKLKSSLSKAFSTQDQLCNAITVKLALTEGSKGASLPVGDAPELVQAWDRVLQLTDEVEANTNREAIEQFRTRYKQESAQRSLDALNSGGKPAAA